MRLRQAVRGSLDCSGQQLFSFELEQGESHSNEVQRSKPHTEPQQRAEKQGPPAHLFQRGPRNPAADEEQRRCEAESPETEQPVSGASECGKMRIENGGQNKERDEPRELDARTAVAAGRNFLEATPLDRCSRESERNDPERAGKFYGGADNQGLGAVFRGGADDGTSVMNRQRGPQSELRLR